MVIKHGNDKGNSSHQPWKDEQCDQAKYAKYAALRVFRLNNQDNTNTNFIESRTVFISVCLHKKKPCIPDWK